MKFATFNFNTKGGVTLSDIVLISFDERDSTQDTSVSNILDRWTTVDVNILILMKTPFLAEK